MHGLRTLPLLFACLAIASFAFTFPARAQDDFVPEELLQQAAEWARDNVDPSLFEVLGVDQDRARQFLAELQKQFKELTFMTSAHCARPQPGCGRSS